MNRFPFTQNLRGFTGRCLVNAAPLFALSLSCCFTLGRDCVGVIIHEWLWETTVLRPNEQLRAEKTAIDAFTSNFHTSPTTIYLPGNNIVNEADCFSSHKREKKKV